MDSDTDEGQTSAPLFTIIRGASFFIIGKFIYNIFEFSLNAVLTRTIGADLYGVYAYASTILTSVLVLTNGGTDKSILKYLPQFEDRPQMQQFMLGLAFITSLCGGLLFVAILFVFAPLISQYTLETNLFTNTLRIFALIVLFDTIAKLVNSTFRALQLVEYEIFLERIIKPFFRLLFVGIALYLSTSFIAVMASILVASILVLGISVWLFLNRLDIRPTLRGSDANVANIKSYYNYSMPLVAKGGASVLRARVDILMVGLFLSSSLVGIYNISLLVAGLLTIPLGAISQLFPPIASKLYSEDKIGELNTVFSTLTRWTITVSLILGLGAIVFRRQILYLFGSEFVAGSSILIIFVIAQLFNNAGGPSGYVLMMTEHQYVVLINQWVFGALNVVLNYVLILELGFMGAAFATAFTLTTLNISRVLEVWYLEQLFPYTLTFFKPLIAGFAALVVMYIIESAIQVWYVVIIGGLAGGSVYMLVLIALGLHEEDLKLLNYIKS